MGSAGSPEGAGKPEAFVAMSFDVRLQPIYLKVVKPVLESSGFACVRADELHEAGTIIEQIRQRIGTAAIVFCDLTFGNPNVFYELGIAHALDKPTLLISQNPANIPFDVRHLRVIAYEDTKIGLLELREVLVDTLRRLAPALQAQPDASAPRRAKFVVPEDLDLHRTALFSNNVEFVRHAVRILGEAADKPSYKRIKDLALTTSNPDLARDAYTALHQIDPAAAQDVLLDSGLRNQREYLVRERVVLLLGSYSPTDKLIKQLSEQTGDSSWGVRQTACKVLGVWGQVKGATALQNALADSQPEVRLEAAEALGRIAESEQRAAAAAKAKEG